MIDDRHGCYQPFDHRSYVLNWNLTVHNLDGMPISRKERFVDESGDTLVSFESLV